MKNSPLGGFFIGRVCKPYGVGAFAICYARRKAKPFSLFKAKLCKGILYAGKGVLIHKQLKNVSNFIGNYYTTNSFIAFSDSLAKLRVITSFYSAAIYFSC